MKLCCLALSRKVELKGESKTACGLQLSIKVYVKICYLRSLQLVCRRVNGVLAAICLCVFFFKLDALFTGFQVNQHAATRVSFNVKLNRDMML